MELRTKTTTGVPVRVVIEPDEIRAYRDEPAVVLVHDYRGGGETVSVESSLSEYLTREPVMRIRRRHNGDFNVDFEAGFQRGTIDVGRDELTKRSQWPTPTGRPYLRWIGVDPKSQEIVKWLEGSV
jgi:hypothetical protein